MNKNDSSSKTKVLRSNNNLIYSGRIDKSGAAEFQKKAFDILNDIKEDEKDNSKEINFHFTSGGGDIASGISIMNTIEELNKKITTNCYCKGFVGSAATYGAFSCKNKYSFDNTLFLLHPPSTTISGQTEDLRISTNNIELWHNNILDIYFKKCDNKCNSEVKKIFKDNKYSTSDEILKMGLIDKILK